jgi:hypothetical protein
MARQGKLYERLSLFRPVNWRAESVLSSTLPPVGSDALAVRYHQYLRLKNKGNKTAGDPIVRVADEIYAAKEDQPTFATTIEARILARQTDTEIASLLGTDARVIGMYRHLFFDVTAKLDNPDWILNAVLLPAYKAARVAVASAAPTRNTTRQVIQTTDAVSSFAGAYFDGTTKMFGYYGGPAVIDLVIHGFNIRAPLPNKDNLAQWLENTYAMRLRHRGVAAIQSLDINKFNVMELLTAYREIVTNEQSARPPEDKDKATSAVIKELAQAMEWTAGAPKGDADGLGVYDYIAAEPGAADLMRVANKVVESTVLEPVRGVTFESVVRKNSEIVDASQTPTG